MVATHHAGYAHAEEDLQPEEGIAATEHASGQATGPLAWGAFLSPQPKNPAAHPEATEAQQPAHEPSRNRQDPRYGSPAPTAVPSTDTIAAVATAVAPGQGGIAVIRLSGPAAEATGRSVVQCPGRQEWGSHRVVYGHVIDGEGRRLDEVLLLLMRGPRSFTGEDVVEIHCHGGVMAVQRVLEQVLRQSGVRRAQPGEFSQRAVLNGRLDLTRAEAVSELVAARSRRAAELAMAGLDGGIQAQITALRERLLTSSPSWRPGWISRRTCRPSMARPCCSSCKPCAWSFNSWCGMASGAMPCARVCGWPWSVAPTWARVPCSIGSADVSGRS